MNAKVAAATEQLLATAPRFRSVAEASGPCDLRRRRADPFISLAESIAYQQLSGKAAATIWGRVVELLDGHVSPMRILRTPKTKLRAAGLSSAKVLAILDLASHVHTGKLNLDNLSAHSDQEITEMLVQVRGIGEWSAHMFLMFQLGRIDVWPTGDLGVRKGWTQIHGGKELITPKGLEAKGLHLKGCRSVAAWYCWRVVDGDQTW